MNPNNFFSVVVEHDNNSDTMRAIGYLPYGKAFQTTSGVWLREWITHQVSSSEAYDAMNQARRRKKK